MADETIEIVIVSPKSADEAFAILIADLDPADETAEVNHAGREITFEDSDAGLALQGTVVVRPDDSGGSRVTCSYVTEIGGFIGRFGFARRWVLAKLESGMSMDLEQSLDGERIA